MDGQIRMPYDLPLTPYTANGQLYVEIHSVIVLANDLQISLGCETVSSARLPGSSMDATKMNVF